MPRPTAYPIWSSFAPRRDGIPVQEQLVRFFRDAVTSGALRPGARVPATRVLAQELSLARNTVGLAYERLAAEGFLDARHGSGTFIPSALPEQRRASRPSVARKGAGAGSQRARILEVPARLPSAQLDWPLTPGLPALDAFPHALWARLTARFWRGRPIRELAYGEAGGYLPLREALAAYLGAARGISCSAEHVIVTPGTQAAMFIVALALADAGERAWVEHPGYEATRRAFMLAGLAIAAVPVDAEGLDVEAGRSAAPDARLAVVAPSHQYPLGVVLSLTRRLALLQWCLAADAYVIEDDYDSEFRYDGAPLPALKALDGDNGRVVYVGTLSKLLAPSLRLGFLVVPDRLVDVMHAVRATVDRHVPLPLQAVAAEFIGNGHLGAHIRRLRAIYAERRAALLAAIAEEGRGRLGVSGSATGLHVIADLPPASSDKDIAAAARVRQVGVTPVSFYAVPDAPPLARQGLLMGFGNTPAAAMAPAVRIVHDCLAEPAKVAGACGRPRGITTRRRD
jgi:GntR family transcriptional regulator / MocR family aminotransferase